MQPTDDMDKKQYHVSAEHHHVYAYMSMYEGGGP